MGLSSQYLLLFLSTVLQVAFGGKGYRIGVPVKVYSGNGYTLHTIIGSPVRESTERERQVLNVSHVILDGSCAKPEGAVYEDNLVFPLAKGSNEVQRIRCKACVCKKGGLLFSVKAGQLCCSEPAYAISGFSPTYDTVCIPAAYSAMNQIEHGCLGALIMKNELMSTTIRDKVKGKVVYRKAKMGVCSDYLTKKKRRGCGYKGKCIPKDRTKNFVFHSTVCACTDGRVLTYADTPKSGPGNTFYGQFGLTTQNARNGCKIVCTGRDVNHHAIDCAWGINCFFGGTFESHYEKRDLELCPARKRFSWGKCLDDPHFTQSTVCI